MKPQQWGAIALAACSARLRSGRHRRSVFVYDAGDPVGRPYYLDFGRKAVILLSSVVR